ncbi:MAG TPA: tetratricopeptide repeat protein [Steroidobacteraceae bacterium]|nr:tetratricopeptide repeat protein [Steroidobacteraceae bacterium]
MAEGLVGGILGEGDDSPEVEAPEAAAGAEAFAAAVAAIASRQDPEVAKKTGIFLEHQSELLKIQARYLQDEHPVRLAILHGQKREARLRRHGIRIRIAFQLFAATVAALIGAGVLLLLYDAFSSRSVIVEPFHAPPVLAANGIDGTVIAARLLDEFARLQNATRSTADKRDISNAWTSEIKLAIPETGVSLGEVSRVLRARLGHDLHLYGDLVDTDAGGLTLTVRGDGVAPKSFTGKIGDLPQLTTDAAEYVYAQAEPALWAYYLQDAGRYPEAMAFCQAAYSNAPIRDRPYLLNVWANALTNTGGDAKQALSLYRAAIRVAPHFWIGYNNVMNTLWWFGDEEGAWRTGEELRKAAGGRPGASPETEYQNWDILTWNLPAYLDTMIADANTGGGTNLTAEGPAIADAEARQHDLAAAELALATTQADERDPTIGAVTHFVRGRLALEVGDNARAASEMEAFQAAYGNPAVASNYPGYNCWIAPAEEAAGHPDKADALLKGAGTFVDCYRFRADILDGRGDWAAAQKAYADAVALAPDLPAGYYSWGLALARHGDLDAAAAKLKQANQKGPHWADPLKAWGDVLAKQGHWNEALAKYDQALKFAPNWKQLKETRAAASNQKN